MTTTSMTKLLLPLAFLLGAVIACTGDDTNVEDSGCTSPGSEGCECIGGTSCLAGLECLSGYCINIDEVGETSDGNDTDPTTTDDGDPTTTSDPTTGDGDGDPSGDGDSDPTTGDGDSDPTTTGDGDGDECIQSYNPCWDFDADEQTGNCCAGLGCLRDTFTQVSACVPSCITHSECVTDCCVQTTWAEDFCSPTTALCDNAGKCIDSCGPNQDGIWTSDGLCDDGGPGADYNVCEYGTDCTDCGPRF